MSYSGTGDVSWTIWGGFIPGQKYNWTESEMWVKIAIIYLSPSKQGYFEGNLVLKFNNSVVIDVPYKGTIYHEILLLNKTELNFYTGKEKDYSLVGYPVRNLSLTYNFVKPMQLYSASVHSRYIKFTK